jgi:3-oxoadipate enol-lactonase
MSEPAGGLIDVLGARVRVEAWGQGPTVLCLHGLGGGCHFFQPLGLALADRYRTLALDLPGAGLSPPLPSPSFDVFAELVIELVGRDSAPLLAVVGHSMGTIIALEALRRAPALCRGLVVVGGLPEAPPEARRRIRDRIDLIARAGLAGLGGQVTAANLSRRTIEERPELAALVARLFEMQSSDGYQGTAAALANWAGRPVPPLAGMRCLLVSGDEDRYAPPDAMEQFARTLPQGSRLEVIPECGHLPFLEQPAAFAALIRPFLDQLAGQT